MLDFIDPDLDLEDQILQLANYMNLEFEVGLNENNETAIILGGNSTGDYQLGDDFTLYISSAVALRDSLLLLDDQESVVVLVFQNHLIGVSRALENFLNTKFYWNSVTSGEETFVSPIPRLWSLVNQATQLYLVILSDAQNVDLPGKNRL